MPTIASLASLLSQIYYSTQAPVPIDPGTSGPWRPPQWGTQASFTMTAKDPVSGKPTAYVFDAAIKVEHEQRSVATQNPIQTGAAITDHVYVVPARVIIEIIMSDAMQSFTIGQWADGPSRSVSAYQTLVALQAQRLPVQIATRLRTYDQMEIVGINAVEEKETAYSLKATVTFQQMLTAAVSLNGSTSQPLSAIPQTTVQGVTGQTLPQGVPSSIFQQNNILNLPPVVSAALPTVPIVAGAGPWTSSNINAIGSTLGLP